MNNIFVDYLERVAKFQHKADENVEIIENYISLFEYENTHTSRSFKMALMALRNMTIESGRFDSGSV